MPWHVSSCVRRKTTNENLNYANATYMICYVDYMSKHQLEEKQQQQQRNERSARLGDTGGDARVEESVWLRSQSIAYCVSHIQNELKSLSKCQNRPINTFCIVCETGKTGETILKFLYICVCCVYKFICFASVVVSHKLMACR